MPNRGTHWLGRFPSGRRERDERLGARLGERCLYLTLPPGGARDLLEFKREAAWEVARRPEGSAPGSTSTSL